MADAVMLVVARRADGPHVEARLGHRARPGVGVRGRADGVSDRRTASRRTPSTTRRATRQRRAPAAERPPLIVIGHGGPIAAADPTFDLKVQFWTTPRLRGSGRELWRQHRLRPRLPAPAERTVGHRRRGGSDQRGAAPRRARARADAAPAGHPRRQRRRLHRAGGADAASGGVHGRSQLLRHQRPRGADRRFAQVRSPVPRHPGRAVSGDARRVSAALADSRRRSVVVPADPAAGARGQGGAAQPVAR